MLHIVSIIAQKGGSGKTTLALTLAVAVEQTGRTPVVLDIDSQATACKWSARQAADPPLVLAVQPARLPFVSVMVDIVFPFRKMSTKPDQAQLHVSERDPFQDDLLGRTDFVVDSVMLETGRLELRTGWVESLSLGFLPCNMEEDGGR